MTLRKCVLCCSITFRQLKKRGPALDRCRLVKRRLSVGYSDTARSAPQPAGRFTVSNWRSFHSEIISAFMLRVPATGRRECIELLLPTRRRWACQPGYGRAVSISPQTEQMAAGLARDLIGPLNADSPRACGGNKTPRSSLTNTRVLPRAGIHRWSRRSPVCEERP